MARKRFTKDEIAAFTPKTAVEYRNGSHWHPATIIGGVEHDTLGLAYVSVEITKTRGLLTRGQYVRGYPTHVRLPLAVNV